MLTRWNDLNRTLNGMDVFRRRMDRLFDEFERGRVPTYQDTSGPAARLHDNGEAIMLYMEVPGLKDEDLDLRIEQNRLTVTGERKVEAPEGFSVHRRERGSMKFSRTFGLECDVDGEKATASLKHGVLTVTLPKPPAALPKKITVKAE